MNKIFDELEEYLSNKYIIDERCIFCNEKAEYYINPHNRAKMIMFCDKCEIRAMKKTLRIAYALRNID